MERRDKRGTGGWRLAKGALLLVVSTTMTLTYCVDFMVVGWLVLCWLEEVGGWRLEESQ